MPTKRATAGAGKAKPVKAWGLINPGGLLWFQTWEDRGSAIEAGITDDHKPVRVTIVPPGYIIVTPAARKGGGRRGK